MNQIGTEARRYNEKLERRLAIQEAALVEFTERGFYGGSIEAIARGCGISVGAVYLYFPSKFDLFMSLTDALGVDADTARRVIFGKAKAQ